MREKRITRVEFPAKASTPTQSPPKKRVAAYARVSTVKDAQENSLQAQREYFTEYIQRNQVWVFAGIYTDDGISGLSMRKRDGFNRMIADALEGKIDLIITKSLSRFARNTVDALTTIRSLKAAGVAVYFQKENINTMDSTGEFLITLMSSFAEEESRSISENIKWGVRHRFAQGIYHLPARLLGYHKNQIDEAEAKVVRFIYLLALTGKGSTEICNILMEYNIPSPGHGQEWNHNTIQSILKNEKYMGDAVLQKKFTVDFLQKKMKVNEGEVPQYYVENGHPAIISKSVWREVQSTWTDADPRNGAVICGDCGGRYGRKIWHSTTYHNAVWECDNRKAGLTKCKCRHIYEKELDTAIRRSLRHLLKTHREITPDCAELLDQTLGGTTEDAQSAIDDIARGKLDIQIDGLMVSILIRKMVVTPGQTMVIHFLDGSSYRHRLGNTPKGTRLINKQREHSQMLVLSAEGYTPTEIARRLGISANTVRSYLWRCHKHREQLN